MPLESGTYISDLNASNPVGATDPKSQGDDHLRLIKSTILATFPNVSGAMTLTHTNLNNALIKNVAGQIISAGSVPSTPTLGLETTRPVLVWDDTDAAVDEGRYYAHSSAGQFAIVAINDANDSSQNAILVSRTGINIDSVQMSVDDAINLEAIGGGQARIRSQASTDTENRRLIFASQAGTQRAAYGHEGGGTLYVRNSIHAGHIFLTAEDTGGVVREILQGDPDGATTLYESGNRVMLTHQQGIHIADSLGGDPFVGFYDTNFAARQGYIQFNDVNGILIAGEVHGAQVRFQAEDAGGTVRIICLGDPDGTFQGYYNGSVRTATLSGGMRVQSAGNTDTEVREVVFAYQDGTERGMVGHDGVATFYIRNKIHGEIIRLTGEDAGGTPVVLADFDPDGSADLYHDATLQLRTKDNDATGATSGAEVRDHGSTYRDVGFNILPSFNVQTSDTLEAQHCGTLQIIANAVGYTLTLEASTSTDFPVGGATHIMHGGSVDYTVTEGATTTLYYVEPGSGRVDTTGGCTIGPGGVATIWRQATNVYYIWGSEISYTP